MSGRSGAPRGLLSAKPPRSFGSRASGAQVFGWSAFTWAVATLPQAVGVAGHGDSGLAGAGVVAVGGAALALLVTVPDIRPWDRVVACCAVVIAGAAGSIPYIGRAPWLITVVLTMIASGAGSGGNGMVAAGRGGAAAVNLGSEGRSGPAAPTAAAVLVVSVWPATHGSIPWVLALGAIALLLVVAARRGVPLCRKVDRSVLEVAGPPIASIRRRSTRVVRWWIDPSTRPERMGGALGSILSVPIFWRLMESPYALVRGTNDFQAHVDRAFALSWSPLFVSVPHPGWHLTFRVLEPVLDVRWAVVLIGAAATGALVGVLVSIGRSEWDDLRPLSPRLAAVYGLSYLLIANPAAFVPRSDSVWGRLPTQGLRARGSSFFPLHLWGSPTITMSLPIVLAMFATVLFAVRGDLVRARRHRVALCALTVAATMVLPAATLALVPAVPIYLVLSKRWDRGRLGVLAPWFLVPGALVALGQTLFLASEVSAYENTRWRWNPFWMVPYFGMNRPAFWLLFAVVPAGIWVAGRRFLADPSIGVSACAFGVAIVPALLLQQTNPEKLLDGDLAMPLLFAAVLLVMSSVRLLLIELQAAWVARDERGFPPAVVFAGTLLTLMACAGVLELLSAAGVVPEP